MRLRPYPRAAGPEEARSDAVVPGAACPLQARRPDVYIIGEKLHALHRARGDMAAAKAAVQRYLAAAPKDAPERARAAERPQPSTGVLT